MRRRILLRCLLYSAGWWLCATVHGAPANDYFTNSIHLEGATVDGTADLTGATREPGEPDHRSNPAFEMTGESAWWSWAAPCTGMAIISNVSLSAVQGAVYTGASVGALQRAVGDPFQGFRVDAGKVYHIAFERRVSGNPLVNFHAEATPFPTNSPNDDFANAAPVGTVACNLAATREPGEPAHRPGGPNKSLWWRWRAPHNSRSFVQLGYGILPDVTMAVYTGSSVETLTLVAKTLTPATLYFTANGGVVYYIAAETPADAVGEIVVNASPGVPDKRVVPVPGNVVANPSFELLNEGFPNLGWTMEGSVEGYVSLAGNVYAADGGNYLGLGGGAQIGQTITTVPGQAYQVKLAIKHGGGTQRVVVAFGEQLSPEYVILPLSTEWYWHWAEFTFTATTNSTRLLVRDLQDGAGIDDVTCAPLNRPPQMVQQPQSRSAYPGGSVTFVAGVTGSEPLRKQWSFNGQPLTNQTGSILNLTDISTNHVGLYQFSATNLYGWTTSAPASLVLAEATSPAIVLQPESRAALPGEFVCLVVAAVGTPPLGYQWFKDGQPLLLETNRHLVILSFDASRTGAYHVVVSSCRETATSLPAVLTLAEPAPGGGQIYFANRQFMLEAPPDAPVFDTDGATPLSGSNFQARLYVGASPDALRAVAQPQPFLSAFGAGFFDTSILTLPDVAPGVAVYAQVRAWDGAQGVTYEEVRALGGRLGGSGILPVVTAGGTWPAPTDGLLFGLQSFNLQYGLPEYRRGRLQLMDRQPGHALVWELVGEPGGRYVIECRLDGANWVPLLTLDNPNGRVSFTNAPPPASTAGWYRAQLLE